MKKLAAFALLTILCLSTVGCGTAPNFNVQQNLFLFGLTQLKFNDGNAEKASSAIRDFLVRFEGEVAVDVEGSDVARINAAEGGEAVTVSEDTAACLALARRMYETTDGAFNPCLFPLTRLWGFSPEYEGQYSRPRPEPGEADIAALLPYADFSTVTVSGRTVIKRYARTQLDLGGVAKGYAVDRCRDIAASFGVTSGIVDVGSNTQFLGSKPDGKPFRVSLRDPRGVFSTEYAAILELAATSVTTSGDYERYYEWEGKRYCHILDGATGRPVQTGVMTVCVVGPEAAPADCYATAAFVLGHEAAARLFEREQVAAVIVFEQDGTRYYRLTAGMVLAPLSGGGLFAEGYEPWTGGTN